MSRTAYSLCPCNTFVLSLDPCILKVILTGCVAQSFSSRPCQHHIAQSESGAVFAEGNLEEAFSFKKKKHDSES